MIPPEDVKRRVRAALALGGYANVEELAEALTKRNSGIGLKRLRVIWQKGDARAVELRELAQVCETPFWFMEHGLAPPIETGEDELRAETDKLRGHVRYVEERVGIVERDAEQTRAELRDLTSKARIKKVLAEHVKALEAGAAHTPPGELGRDATDSPPKPPHPEEGDSHQGKDAPPSNGEA